MSKAQVSQIRKRDGSTVPFESGKIQQAIAKDLAATQGGDKKLAAGLARRVVALVGERFPSDIPGVEDIQDVVEEVLMAQGYAPVAKAYILYRQQRADVRRLKRAVGVRDDLKLSVNAIKVLERRYLLKDEEGNVIETPTELFRRVARAIAAAETSFDPAADTKQLEQEFFELMSNLEFMPNTPTLMNAGAPLGQLSRSTSKSRCSGTMGGSGVVRGWS